MEPFASRLGEGQIHLRILATTDLHAHVLPHDYYLERPLATAGLARTAALIDIARTEAANTLLFDNGDFLQGNPMGDFFALAADAPGADGNSGATHPMIAAMNLLGYDAVTPGNHDFNYGLEFLAETLSRARFPAVSTNLVLERSATPLQDRPWLPPYAMLERQVTDATGARVTLTIGVLGLLPPQTVQWDHDQLAGRVEIRDITETAQIWVPELRRRGADLVVVLAHTGIGQPEHLPGQENAALPLARVPGIDALVLGHCHHAFPTPDDTAPGAGGPGVAHHTGLIFGTPSVMPGFWGSHLGVIDLALGRDANGAWRVQDHRVEARAVSRRDATGSAQPLTEPSVAVMASAAEAHARTLTYIRRPVGRITRPLSSYFALAANEPGLHLIAEAQRRHLQRALAGTEYEALPILAAVAPFKCGGRGGPDHYTHIEAGDVALRNVADLYLFPNTIRALCLTGAELTGWLERAAGVFHRITPGAQDALLINPDFPCYNFDVIDGLTYAIDLTQPARFDPTGHLVAPEARRILDLRCQGRAVAPEDRFILASNSYRVSGVGRFPGAAAENVVYTSRHANRDLVTQYLSETGSLDPVTPTTWRFAREPGTSVLYETSPEALAYLPLVSGIAITPLDLAPSGFQRYRIQL
jgi:2',3'-cyclic-nucleotide 2'-phosphodiesterase / 3'-nucleotidase